MSSKETQKILADIFENSERPDKMNVSIYEPTKSIVVAYEDIDEQWFDEIKQAIAEKENED